MHRSRKVLEPPHATRPLSQWLQAGLKPAGFDAILLERRHVKRRCLAMTVKTDRNDARGLAQLMRMGWFRPVPMRTKAQPKRGYSIDEDRMHFVFKWHVSYCWPPFGSRPSVECHH
jgi:hypothetical protein